MGSRLTLYCVCDHERFMSCDIALFCFDNIILKVLRNLLVLLVVVFWEEFRHHVIFVWRLKNLFRHQLYQGGLFLVLVVQRLFWFSLKFGG